jgi:hypothetical protein
VSESNYTKLASINVNDKIEKKNGLSYLSWAWSVDQLLRADPTASWTYGEPVRWNDTVMVFCTVTAFGKPMTAQLPVMDYKNKAISKPDAFAVNTAMQRCLAKAIALHGLGLYIYAGEDVPEEDKTINPVKEAAKNLRLSDQAKNDLEEMALSAVDYFNAGNEVGALKIAHSIEDNEEKIYFWDLLKTESKLRAFITANPRK